jgi:exosortase
MPLSYTAALVFLALSPSWIRFPSVWAASREHGFAIGALCLWLLWQRRRALREPTAPNPVAFGALAVASVLWWVSVESGLQAAHLLLAPLILLLWLTAAVGDKAARAAAPVAATFLLAVPLWEVLVPLLQLVTVLVNQSILKILGINAQIRDTYIILRSGVLEVADSCSGLNFLLVGTAIGAAFAWLFLRKRTSRMQVVAVAVAISLVANWLRVLGLVLVADATNMQSSLMKDHEVYGWSIFVVGLVVLFVIARRIELREVQFAADVESVLTDSNGTAALPIGRARLVGSALVAVLGPAAMAILAVSPTIPPSPADVPQIYMAGRWAAAPADSLSQLPASFRGARVETRAFSDGSTLIRMDRFKYAVQSEEAELVSGDNRIAPDSSIAGSRMVGPLDASFRMVRETAVRGNGRMILVWSWYRVAGVETPSAIKAKLLQFSGTLRRRTDAEAVLLSTRCAASDCSTAIAALYSIVTGQALPSPSAEERPRR